MLGEGVGRLVEGGFYFLGSWMAQTDRQTDRETQRPTGRQTDRQAYQYTDGQTNRLTDIATNILNRPRRIYRNKL